MSGSTTTNSGTIGLGYTLLGDTTLINESTGLILFGVTGAKVWVGSFARGKLRDPIGDSETVSVGPPIRRDGAAL